MLPHLLILHSASAFSTALSKLEFGKMDPNGLPVKNTPLGLVIYDSDEDLSIPGSPPAPNPFHVEPVAGIPLPGEQHVGVVGGQHAASAHLDVHTGTF